jgi:hypothetical protein
MLHLSIKHSLLAAAIALALPLSLHAQDAPEAAPPAPAPALKSDILVHGQPKVQKRSGWKKAETEHIILYSDGSEPDLVQVAGNLELLHGLMVRLYGKAGETEGSPKLQVVLFASREDLPKLALRHMRTEEGPYFDSFAHQRYYDPRPDGDVLALARRDQMVYLDTMIARDHFCEILAEEGEDCIKHPTPYTPPVGRAWQAVLYSAFAQHFIMTNAPAAYPRWYLDGVGALFSTIEIHKNGSIDYAQPPQDYKKVLYAYGDLNARAVLTGTYLSKPSSTMVWTPYHAWLLTHFFAFSDLKKEERAEFDHYMAAVARGASLEQAAASFAHLTEFGRKINDYANRDISFAKTGPAQDFQSAPRVSVITMAEAAALKARVQMGDLSPDVVTSKADEMQPQPWVGALQGELNGMTPDAGAMLVAAEAQCRSGQFKACVADAEKVLSGEPDNARALAWKGAAMAGLALLSPPEKREGDLSAARLVIGRALQSVPHDPIAAMALFQSYTKAGEKAPQAAVLALANLARRAPAAGLPRLDLGRELVREGQSDMARRLLQPLLYAAYDSPEKQEARALFSMSQGTENNVKMAER